MKKGHLPIKLFEVLKAALPFSDKHHGGMVPQVNRCNVLG